MQRGVSSICTNINRYIKPCPAKALLLLPRGLLSPGATPACATDKSVLNHCPVWGDSVADPRWAHSYHQLSPHRSSSKELSQHAQGQNYKLIPREERIFRLLTLLSFHTHASEWMRSSSSLGELPPSQARVSTAATFGNTLTRFTWVLVIFFSPLFFLLQLKMKLLFTAIDHL